MNPSIVMFIYCSILTIFISYLFVMIVFKNNKIVKFSNRLKNQETTILAMTKKLQEYEALIISANLAKQIGNMTKTKKKKISGDENKQTKSQPGDNYTIDDILKEISDNGGNTDNIDPKKLEFLKKYNNKK